MAWATWLRRGDGFLGMAAIATAPSKWLESKWREEMAAIEMAGRSGWNQNGVRIWLESQALRRYRFVEEMGPSKRVGIEMDG